MSVGLAETQTNLAPKIREFFGKYCFLCGVAHGRLKITRFNRTRPESMMNCGFICEECAEYHSPGLFIDPTEREFRGGKWRQVRRR